MPDRIIDLKELYQQLRRKAATYPQGKVQAFIHAITSELLVQDDDIQKAINAVFKTVAKDDSIDIVPLAAKLSAKYKTLNNVLHGIGRRILDSAEAAADVHLRNIGEDLIKLSALIPDQGKIVRRLGAAQSMFMLSAALGGTYLPVVQTILPTMGGDEKNNVVSESLGNCGGLAMECAEQYVERGFPTLPINASIKVLEKQLAQREICARDYVRVPKYYKENVLVVDFVELINSLEPNHPHYIVVWAADKKAGHAICVTKHVNGTVHLHEPNYGHQFFLDAEAAGMEFAFILQGYHVDYCHAATGFCADTIEVYKHKSACKVTIADPFPGKQFLEIAVAASCTDGGYNNFIANVNKHLNYLFIYVKEEKLTYVLLHALWHANYKFTREDIELVIEFLELIAKNENRYLHKYKKIISESIFIKILMLVHANKNGEQAVLTVYLEWWKQRLAQKQPVDTNAGVFLQEIRKLEKHLRTVAFELCAEVAQNRLEGNEVAAREAQDKSILYMERYYQLRKNNILGKMLAGQSGKITYTYTDAVKSIRDLFGVELSVAATPVAIAEKLAEVGSMTVVNKHLRIQAKRLRQLDFLTNAIAYLDAELHKQTEFGMDLRAVRQKVIIVELKTKVIELRKLVDDIRTAVLLDKDYSDAESIINKLLAPMAYAFDTLPDVNKVSEDFVVDLRVQLERSIRFSISSEDFIELNCLYKTLASTPPGSFMNVIERLGTQNVTKQQVLMLEELKEEMIALRQQVRHAVVPQSDVNVQNGNVFKMLLSELRRLSPVNVSKAGELMLDIEPDFAAYLQLATLPQQILSIVDEVSGLHPDFHKYLRSQFTRNNTLYQNNRITFRTWLENVFADIEWPRVSMSSYAGVTASSIKCAISLAGRNYVRRMASIPAPVSSTTAKNVNAQQKSKSRAIGNKQAIKLLLIWINPNEIADIQAKIKEFKYLGYEVYGFYEEEKAPTASVLSSIGIGYFAVRDIELVRANYAKVFADMMYGRPWKIMQQILQAPALEQYTDFDGHILDRVGVHWVSSSFSILIKPQTNNLSPIQCIKTSIWGAETYVLAVNQYLDGIHYNYSMNIPLTRHSCIADACLAFQTYIERFLLSTASVGQVVTGRWSGFYSGNTSSKLSIPPEIINRLLPPG